METMTLRPQRSRIFLYQLLSGAVGAVVTWLVFSWLGIGSVTIIVGIVIGTCIGSLLRLNYRAEWGTIRIDDGSIRGPGRFFGRVTAPLHGPPEHLLRKESFLDRLSGVCWIETSAGRIRITKPWYRRADLDRFLVKLRPAPGLQ